MAPLPEVIRLNTREAMGREAAGLVADLARVAVVWRGRCAVILPGGTTPRPLYRALAVPPLLQEVPWGRLDLFLADERSVPAGHPDANAAVVRDLLLRDVPLPAGAFHHPPEGMTAEDAAGAYQGEIGRVLGGAGGAPPSADLAILGIGADGHVASLFPGHPALGETGRWAAAVREPGARPPWPRVTMTIPLLAASRTVLFLAAGEEKAAAVRRLLTGVRGPDSPASLVTGRERTLLLVAEMEP
jgi:6-phosphogluconolactonase